MSELQAIADRVPLAGSVPKQGALADPLATGIAASPGRSTRVVMEEVT